MKVLSQEKVKKRRGLLNVLKKGEVKKIHTFKSPRKSKNVPKNANKFTQKRMKDHQTIDKLQPRPPF